MKKLFIFLFFAVLFVGCESENTYSGLCKDKDGNRIIFSHFKMYNYINDAVLYNKSQSMTISIKDMDECYMFKDGGKCDKDNKDKKSD